MLLLPLLLFFPASALCVTAPIKSSMFMRLPIPENAFDIVKSTAEDTRVECAAMTAATDNLEVFRQTGSACSIGNTKTDGSLSYDTSGGVPTYFHVAYSQDKCHMSLVGASADYDTNKAFCQAMGMEMPIAVDFAGVEQLYNMNPNTFVGLKRDSVDANVWNWDADGTPDQFWSIEISDTGSFGCVKVTEASGYDLEVVECSSTLLDVACYKCNGSA